MIAATISDYLTDEDSENAGLVARMLTESYMRKPSLEDKAMRGIMEFVGSRFFAEIADDRNQDSLCAFAVVFMFRGKARWVTGGGSMVYHFEDGQLVRYSQCIDAPPLGEKEQYEVELEDGFQLSGGKNAFLLCSKEMAKQTPPELLERTLQNSQTPEQWLQNIVAEIGEARQFCANAVFLPQKRTFGKRVGK